MPRVPLLDRQVEQRPVQVAAPNATPTPPAAAFGAPQAEARARAGETVSRIGDLLAQHAVRLQEREDDKQVLLNQTAFQKEVQDVLYSKETDGDGRPRGFMMRSLSQAKGSTLEFDAGYAKIREKYLGNVASGRQKAKLGALLDSHYESVRGTVIRHEAAQGEADFRQVLDTSLQENIDAAGAVSDPADLARTIRAAQVSLGVGLKHLGYDDRTIAVKNQELAGKMVETSISSILETDYKAAQALFEANKPGLPAATATRVQAALEGKAFSDQRISVWTSLSGPAFRRSDGTFDQEKQRAAVFALDGVPTDRKEKLFDYVQARANEAESQMKERRAATDREFMNALYTAKKQGAGLDRALVLAGQFGYDAYDTGIKENVVKDLYSSPRESDPGIYIALWEGIQGKLVDRRAIDQAFTEGRVSVSDWEGLRKDYWRSQMEGTSPAEKQMKERIDILAVQKFGSNKKRRDQYLYTVQQLGRGKAPEEQWKIANDLLKDVDVSWSFFDKPAWEAEAKQLDAENLAWGQLYQDMGRDAVQAVGRGVLLAGKPAWGVQDLVEFADTFGGVESVKPGTPAGNAIQSLIKHGELVTPGNVNAVVSRYKDGIY